MTQGILIIFSSPNGRDNWTPVKPEDIPAFVKDPDTLGRMVAGEMCCDPCEGQNGSDWYRAERADNFPTSHYVQADA